MAGSSVNTIVMLLFPAFSLFSFILASSVLVFTVPYFILWGRPFSVCI